jgi:hypothetical protein
MFSVGDNIEFHYEGFDKNIQVKGKIARINEFGCFIIITNTSDNRNSLLIRGCTYNSGDEVYITNKLLRSNHVPTKQVQYNNDNEELSWIWVAFLLGLTVLLILDLAI